MKKPVDLLIFMPVGSECRYEYVNDNIDSISHHIDADKFVLLIVNDSGKPDFHDAIQKNANIYIHDVPLSAHIDKRPNTFGSLFTKQIVALREISELYDWQSALRIDDDALVIGPNPQDDALAIFDADETLGLLGAYKYRGDGTNKEAAMYLKGRGIIKQLLRVKSVSDLKRSIHLLRVVKKALQNGYRLGDMCTGGSVFLSRNAIEGMSSLLAGSEALMATSKLDDDLLFALYAAASGLQIGEFSRPDHENHVMAINYRGLPMPLEELIEKGKKLCTQ